MLMFTKHGKALIASAVATSMAALACGVAFATTPQEPVQQEGAPASGDRLTMAEWAELYPDQYASYATPGWNVEKGVRAGHYLMFQNMQQWDHATLTCMKCKTTQSYEMLEAGYDPKTPLADLVPEVDAFFDCYVCHSDPETLEIVPGIRSFDEKRETYIPDAPTGTILCGQCHTGYTPGFDIDTIYEERLAENIETGRTPDEKTGVMGVTAGHPDVEIFYDSVHANLGLTCIDCHMATVENADGEPMTNHNASGHLTDNLPALETCLECHSAQGVETAADMKAFVKNAQAELAAAGDEARAAINELKALLEEATAAGEESETLDQARELCSRAAFNLTYVEGKHNLGNKVAHDPAEQHEIVTQAAELAQQGIDLLS